MAVATGKNSITISGDSDSPYIIGPEYLKGNSPSETNMLITGLTRRKIEVQISGLKSITILNCSALTLYIDGIYPSIVLDKCSGVNMSFLSKEGAEAVTIIYSVCDELMFTIPGATPEDDPIETLLPEQFQTKMVNGSIISSILEHHG
ncbi:MAG: hypothetical protein ACPGN3_13775 [Opitutales bacterium]